MFGKNRVFHKIFIFLLLAFYPFLLKANENPYSVFDDRIYDQRGLFTTPPNIECLNDPRYQKAILQHLTQKKIELLESNLFTVYDKELEKLSDLAERYKPSLMSRVFKGGGQLAVAAAGLGVLAIPGVAPEVIAMRIFMATAAGVTTVGTGMTLAHEFLLPDGNFDIDKLKIFILQKKTSHIQNINKEAGISDLEIQYILKKPLMENEELKKSIEAAFIGMRKPGIIGLDYYREYIVNFLKLPLQRMQITVPPPLLNLEGKTPNDFNALSPLQREAVEDLLNYTEEVKSEISRLLIQINYSSYSGNLSQRKFYYFYGDPGIGKTTAAKNIARFLQLPLSIKSIRTGADLSATALEGQDWLYPGAHTGFLARALSEKPEEPVATTSRHTIDMSFQEITRYGLSFKSFHTDLSES